MWQQFAFVLLTVLAFAPLRVWAQDDSSCRVRRIIVNAMDRNRFHLTNLKATDFRGEIGGRLVQVRAAARPKTPRHVMLLIDTSGSMLGNTPASKDLSKSALLLAAEIIRKSPPKDHVRVAFFSETVRARVDFPSEDRDAVEARLQQAEPTVKGRTAIFDSIRANLNDEDRSKQEPLEVVLLTDAGGDNRSKSIKSDVGKMMVLNNTRLYAVLMRPHGFPMNPEEREGPNWMSELAKETGGGTLWSDAFEAGPNRERTVREAAERLVTWWLTASELEIVLPVALNKWSKWKLQLVDQTGRVQKKIDLAYPRELVPCDAMSQ